MKALVTITLALAALVLCVPLAGATPDSYQPQLKADTSDVVSRYLEARKSIEPPSDVVDRAVAIRQASIVPQDSFDRAPIADRPISSAPVASGAANSSSGLRGFGLVGALILAIAAGAVGAAVVTPLGRRTMAHR
jgi:hypothetical protein